MESRLSVGIDLSSWNICSPIIPKPSVNSSWCTGVSYSGQVLVLLVQRVGQYKEFTVEVLIPTKKKLKHPKLLLFSYSSRTLLVLFLYCCGTLLVFFSSSSCTLVVLVCEHTFSDIWPGDSSAQACSPVPLPAATLPSFLPSCWTGVLFFFKPLTSGTPPSLTTSPHPSSHHVVHTAD